MSICIISDHIIMNIEELSFSGTGLQIMHQSCINQPFYLQ